MQEISKNRHEHTFLTGWYTNNDGKLTAGYKIYNSNTAKLIAEHKYSSDNIFNIIDSIANQVRYDLELPERHIMESKFLSVQDLLTNSPEAFEYQIKGQITWNIDRNDYGCMEHVKKSVELDPTNPWARWILAETYVFTNQLDKAMEHYKAGFKHAYKFTESLGKGFKGKYYQWVEKNGNKNFKNTKMFAEMNPYDRDAQFSLVSEYYHRYMIDEALAKLNELRHSYPDNYDILSYISFIYEMAGDFDNAISYAKEYANYYPNDANTYRALGYTYDYFGYYNQSIENYEKALLIDPNNFRYLTSLSKLKLTTGKFEESKKICEQMLELSNLPEDFENAYDCIETYYRIRGQIRKSIDIIGKELESANERSLGDDIDWSGRHREISNRYLTIGNYDKALEHLHILEEQTLDIFKDKRIFDYIKIYHMKGDIKKLRSLIKPMEKYLKAQFNYKYEKKLLSTKGLVNQLEGDYDSAIDNFKKARKYSKISGSLIDLAKTYQLSGKLNNARKYIDMSLDLNPFGAYERYLSALIYEDSGNLDRAKGELEIALDVWSNADEDHVYAKKVREKIKELNEN